MDTEVATSYCTTNKANIIYHLVLDPWDFTPRNARKYRHIGGIFVIHPSDPTPHGNIDTEVADSRV